jgi:hypothetical protein
MKELTGCVVCVETLSPQLMKLTPMVCPPKRVVVKERIVRCLMCNYLFGLLGWLWHEYQHEHLLVLGVLEES